MGEENSKSDAPVGPTPTWDDLAKKDAEIAHLRGNIKDLERLVKLLQNNKGADYIR